MTLDDLCEAMRAAKRARIVGTGSRLAFLPHWDGEVVDVHRLSGIVSHDVADQVVEVLGSTPVESLQQELRKGGQCLPLVTGLPRVVSQAYGTVGGLLATNLPHALSSQCGGPRDWTLGMTVVRADGTVAKCGSKAVKSVAGYDAHRLFVGSRGTLCAIASAILRIYPIRAVPPHEVEVFMEEEPRYVSRTLRSDFKRTREATKGLVAVDQASCTLWSLDEPPLPAEAWLLGPAGAIKRPQQPTKFDRRAREVFDPEGKLAPGWQE